jgi:DNA-binding beta-propeller fold protein YncE
MAATTQPAKPGYPRVDLVPGYVVDANWPAERPEEPWGQMAGVTTDADGNVWTLNRGKLPVQVFSPDGKLVQTWPNAPIRSGHQIRIDAQGNVWIADYKAHVVSKFDPAGKPLLTIGTQGEAARTSSHFNLPTDIAIAPSGDVFITDGYANNRVVHCDANGKFVNAWGSSGIERRRILAAPLHRDRLQGLLYVADRNNNRIQVFEQSGKVPPRVERADGAVDHCASATGRAIRRSAPRRSRCRGRREHGRIPPRTRSSCA